MKKNQKHLALNVPTELKSLDQWVCWKYATNSKNPEKPKKRPVNARTGKFASVMNPYDYSSFKSAKKLFMKGNVDGIGFVFTKNDPYTGIDLDHCRDAGTKTINNRSQKIIKRLNSYTELSPSKTGVHIIVKGELPGTGINEGNFEIYDKDRYFTFTGDSIHNPPKEVKKRQKKIDSLIRFLKKLRENVPSKTKKKDISNLSDVEIIAKMLESGRKENITKLIAGDSSDYPSHSEADLAFCGDIARVTKSIKVIDRIFRSSNLYREKWDEIHGSKTYGNMTITTALENALTTIEEHAKKEDPQYIVAQKVILQIGRKNIFSESGQIWRWNLKKGIWQKAAEEEIKKIIHEVAHISNISQNHVNSVFGIIKTAIYEQQNLFEKQNRNVINCINGDIHVEDKKCIFKDHDRKNYSTLQIPVTFDKSAKCEKFKRFLEQIFKPDTDRVQKIELLQEFIGYSLIMSCPFERALFLVGSGGNGKSVILEVLKSLLGQKNVSGVQPSQFENKFQLAHLQGKLANIITEIPQGSVMADAKYKSLISGELITAEHKFKSPFDFQPYSTMFFATNHLPHTKDFSGAFFRRTEILTFNVNFKGDKCDTTLKDELPKELPGILNFALAGLKRLYKNKDFTQVECSLNAKTEWERSADQVKAFVDDRCELDPTAQISVAILFINYQSWASENGVKSGCSKPTFTTRLIRLGCKRKKGSKGARFIVGIKLTEK